MDYSTAVGLLKKYKISVVEGGVVQNKEDALKLAKQLGYPIVLKVISPEISHKSDRGCVRVGISNPQSLSIAYRETLKHAGNARVDGVLVQKMARPGVELIIGGKKDEQFGPLVLFGIGGIFVEVLKDVSMRVCPIKRSDAKEMVHEIKGFPLLTGVRGREPVDLKSLETLLVNVSHFLYENKNIGELDLNPVIAYKKGYAIVDVRVVE